MFSNQRELNYRLLISYLGKFKSFENKAVSFQIIKMSVKNYKREIFLIE